MSNERTINRRHIKLSTFTAEIPEDIDPSKRTYITVEADVYAVEERNNQEGSIDLVWKAKVNGSTICKQDGSKPIISKSKRSMSQKLKQKLWLENPDETYYETEMAKIIASRN